MTSATPSMMRAWQLAGPRRLEPHDVPAPRRTTTDQVLLHTVVGAVCGSDLPWFDGAVSTLFDDRGARAAEVPGYPLHEVVGEVLESDDPDLPVGAHAVGWATGSDALAELTLTHAASLLRVPADLDPHDAVVLQPLACVLDTMARLGDLAGRHVAVVGLGPFGLLFTHAARVLGAGRVTGVDPIDRSDVAARYGMDEAVHAHSGRWAARIADVDRPDVVIEAVGHQTHTVAHAIEAAAPGATIFLFGVPDEPVYPVPLQLAFRKGLTLRTGIVTERRPALEQAVEHLRRHPDLAAGYFTHTFGFAEATEAFERASRSRPGQVKVRLLAEDALHAGGADG
ncbi:zinc-binding dehydrogenase [Aeromicrobium sp.]|uniref:zinc-dependent alcohol dehydrogenase n=1 Tax=Aeromicrobium sp. TaxID=1871063 RepID=UPI0025C2BA55|nr:zinc-binding dehydrogenase [Aeromicrobium sp.]